VGDPKHIFLSIPPQLDGYAAVVNRWHNPGTDTGMVFVLGIHRLLDNSQYEGLHLYIKHTDCKALEVNKLSIAQGQTPPTNQIRIYARVYMGFILLALAIAIGLMISLLSYRFNWFGQRDKLDAVLRFPWISDG